MKKIISTESSRSWFCVLNNPQNIFGNISPDEMVNKAIETWCDNKPTRACAVNYEIGDAGTPHMHMVLEDTSKTRFSALQKLFKGIHIEPTRGSKEQAMDYINKVGRFEEKNHTVIVPAVLHGEIKANKGKRHDLDTIQELLDNGLTPNDIMDMSIHFRQHEVLIRKAYYRKRFSETPPLRDVLVYWHVGEAGSGKSFTYTTLCEKHGIDNVYFLNDYENGGFDNYNGEPILFMDEFKGNLRFQSLLNYLDRYRIQVHCRFANACALWSEVHITSVFPPEEAYLSMVEVSQRSKDKYEQLKRRISFVVLHQFKDGNFISNQIPMSEYKDYTKLKEHFGIDDFMEIDSSVEIPFQ